MAAFVVAAFMNIAGPLTAACGIAVVLLALTTCIAVGVTDLFTHCTGIAVTVVFARLLRFFRTTQTIVMGIPIMQKQRKIPNVA